MPFHASKNFITKKRRSLKLVTKELLKCAGYQSKGKIKTTKQSKEPGQAISMLIAW